MRAKTIAAVLVAAVPISESLPAQESRAATRTKDIAFTGATGTVRLEDFRGKQAVVLLFMRGFTGEATCYYCGEQTRAYRAQYERLRAAGAEVLMVLPLAKDIAGYLKKVGESGEVKEPGFTTPFPVVLDPEGVACKAFGVATDPGAPDFPVFEPATIVLGKDGTTIFEQHGKNPGDRPPVAAVLAALGGKEAKPAAEPEPAAAAPARAWSGYAEGMADARARRKPILLEFHAVW